MHLIMEYLCVPYAWPAWLQQPHLWVCSQTFCSPRCENSLSLRKTLSRVRCVQSLIVSILLCYSSFWPSIQIWKYCMGRVSERVFTRARGIASCSGTVTGMACADVIPIFQSLYKAGWRAWILLCSIPYCQWQYRTAYATRVSTKPSLWEWVSIALFCSYQCWWSDIRGRCSSS